MQSAAKTDYLEQKRYAAAKRKAEQRIVKAKAESARLESALEDLEELFSAADESDYVRLAELYAKKEETEEALLAAYEEIEAAEAELALYA